MHNNNIMKKSPADRIFLAIVYLFLHIKTGLAIKQRVGEALNPLLGATARNLLVFTILVSVVWICKGLGL